MKLGLIPETWNYEKGVVSNYYLECNNELRLNPVHTARQ